MDWIVKLIDVYPEQNPKAWEMAGHELMVSNEVFRGRYRQSMSAPKAITPGAVLDYTFSLHTQNYTFLQGHRVMVQVQSSWFPLVDRNPQKFCDIYTATDADFQKATQRIYRSPQAASQLRVGILKGEK